MNSLRQRRRFAVLALAIVCPSLSRVLAEPAVIPTAKAVQVLAASAETPEAPYLAFPAVLDLGGEVLVSFKHGRSHAADPGATLDLLRLDPATGHVQGRSTLAQVQGEIMQMGEWARFANGDIANYIDAQRPAAPSRTGLRVVRSNDGGRTFGQVERVGPVDGVEYGYAFDAMTRGETTWMLVMTFANLTGGTLVLDNRSQPGSVDVIRTGNNGRTWHFVRSITRELGNAPINESAFVAHGAGFLITARGYDNRQWLLRTDGEFHLQAKVDLTAANECIKGVIGRPRLFTRDGGFYLLGRNSIDRGPMRLSLLKFDPETLAITRHVLLDNAEGKAVKDGYYAQPYWREHEGGTQFNVITYKSGEGRGPDLLRLEFDWKEVR